MFFGQLDQLPPQIIIGHRLPSSIHPPVLLPVFDPTPGEGVDQVGAVRIKADTTFSLQLFQAPDGGHKLHSLVGSIFDKTGDFFVMGTEHQAGSPASRPRIATAGSVGVDLHSLSQLVHPFPVWRGYDMVFMISYYTFHIRREDHE